MYGGFILHHHTCVFPWRRRSAFLLAMAVWVLEPNTAVVSPTSIPLREVLVLPDAETHILTHRQQHTHRHVHKLLTQNVQHMPVLFVRNSFFPARVEMYCTVHNARSLGTESVFLKLRVCFCRSLLEGGMLISRIVDDVCPHNTLNFPSHSLH